MVAPKGPAIGRSPIACGLARRASGACITIQVGSSALSVRRSVILYSPIAVARVSMMLRVDTPFIEAFCALILKRQDWYGSIM